MVQHRTSNTREVTSASRRQQPQLRLKRRTTTRPCTSCCCASSSPSSRRWSPLDRSPSSSTEQHAAAAFRISCVINRLASHPRPLSSCSLFLLFLYIFIVLYKCTRIIFQCSVLCQVKLASNCNLLLVAVHWVTFIFVFCTSNSLLLHTVVGYFTFTNHDCITGFCMFCLETLLMGERFDQFEEITLSFAMIRT